MRTIPGVQEKDNREAKIRIEIKVRIRDRDHPQHPVLGGGGGGVAVTVTTRFWGTRSGLELSIIFETMNLKASSRLVPSFAEVEYLQGRADREKE